MLYGGTFYTRNITYTLQVPSNATGTAEFIGEFLYNVIENKSVILDIEGDKSITVGFIADTDGDGKIDDFELLSYINLWVQGFVDDFALLSVVDEWAQG